MSARRAVVPLLLACLLTTAGCASLGPGLAPVTGSGTVHGRVVSGSGGSRLVIVPVYLTDSGPYDFALDTGAARSVVDSRVASRLRLPVTGSEQTVTGVSGTSQAARVRVSAWRVDSVEDYRDRLVHALELDVPSLIVLPIDYSIDVAMSELGAETVAT